MLHLISIFLFAPVFISNHINEGVVLNRFGGGGEEYSRTFPVSLVMVAILAIIKSKSILGALINKGGGVIIITLISLFLLQFEVERNVVLSCLLFTFSNLVFNQYFRNGLKQIDQTTVASSAALCLIVPSLLVMGLDMIFQEKYGFIGDDFAIYNYEQYF